MGPELNAGYSFVTMVRAIMTFDEASMDTAYRNLEATEKFCDTSRKLFGSNSFQESLTPHERLYRQAIVLYESILKQGITSYVKGGVGHHLHSPLSHHTAWCAEHVGTSLYDQDGDKLEEVDGGAGSEDQREAVDLEGQRELAASLAAVAEGIGGMGLESGLLEMSEGERMPRLSDVQVCVG
eukprot:Em0005g368a